MSPWSHDGTRLLFQTNDNGSLWVMSRNGSGRSRLTPEVPGFLKVPDVQWVDFDSHPSDLLITDIRPIQVIEDAPLVLDKATMVRVFVKLTGSNSVGDVTMKLDFGGQPYTLTYTVVNHGDVTYVLPPERVSDFDNNKRDPTYLLKNYVRKGFTR